MGEGAEGGTDIGAMVECRHLAIPMRGDCNIVPGVREAVKHRCVLREKQCGNQQQRAEQSGHLF
jgi:hypothetical protein